MSNEDQDKRIVIYEERNQLVLKERINGVLVTVMRVAVGAVTQAQLAYFRANIQGKIIQEEVDLILKYFYGIEVD
jgi:hypothetical protein